MHRFALVLLALTSPAHAEDCLDYSQATLYAVNGHLVVCTGADACTRFDDAKAKPQKAPHVPDGPAPKSPLETRDGKPSVCVNGHCAPLPPKLAAATAKAKHVQATLDLSRVVVDETDLWSFTKDATARRSARRSPTVTRSWSTPATPRWWARTTRC